ncbi:N-6 DNA methylase [bacterium]|nr:N-6 DNA methylase [bacterium]
MMTWFDRFRLVGQRATEQSGMTVDIDAVIRDLDPTPEGLARAFESIRFDENNLRHRRQTGAYYTPRLLIDPILEHSLIPVMQRRMALSLDRNPDASVLTSVTDLSEQDRLRASGAILAMRILDPSCGPGLFLLAAGELLADRLTWLCHGSNATDEQRQQARQQIASQCLFGIDSDPSAMLAARAVLGIWASPGDARFEIESIVVGDGLDQPALLPDQRFDVVIGNPPFANAIEKEGDAAIGQAKRQRSETFQDLRGTADLAYYFIARAHASANDDGAVGFVLPRAFLSTSSCQRLRARLLTERPPALLFAPPSPFLFTGANIFVCAVVLRKRSPCVAGSDRLEPIDVKSDNWWSAMIGTPTLPSRTSLRVGNVFNIIASMTTGIAYDLVPCLREATAPEMEGSEEALPIRLVTTGLIEPGRCDWGKRPCRYLKRDYQHPVIDISSDKLLPAVRERLRKVARPKVLVAGLSLRVEAILDEVGNLAGAVSTYTILEKENNVDRLRMLCDYLNSPVVSEQLSRELGATALGGGRMTLTKSFLAGLTWPENETAQPKDQAGPVESSTKEE